MGILNVTPDSFSDGGKFFRGTKLNLAQAVKSAGQMIAEGADIIDVGGESSGPGSVFVPISEELARVIPVVQAIHKKYPRVQISIDTYKAEVAREAIASGASIVNDVTGLRGDKHMAQIIADAKVPVIIMYSKDKNARTTRAKKSYKDVVRTIIDFLDERVQFAVKQGIRRNKIIIDPGMGAFISGEPKYSFEVLRRLTEFKKLRLPILVGASRKSFLPGALSERLLPTIVAHIIAVQNGATMIRVHDVKEHVDAINALIGA